MRSLKVSLWLCVPLLLGALPAASADRLSPEGFWLEQVRPEDFSDGQVHLAAEMKTAWRAGLTTKERFRNQAFRVSFEVRPLSEEIHPPGRGFVVRFLHPSRERHWDRPGFYWRITYSGGCFLAEVRQDGRRVARALGPPNLPADTWYRISVTNRPTSVRVQIRAEDGATIADASLEHDDGPPVPQPLRFSADVSLVGVEHRGQAPIPSVWGGYGTDSRARARFRAELLRPHGIAPRFGCLLRDLTWHKARRLAPTRPTPSVAAEGLVIRRGPGSDLVVSTPQLILRWHGSRGPEIHSRANGAHLATVENRAPFAFTPSGEPYALRLASRRAASDPADSVCRVEERWRDAHGRIEVVRTYTLGLNDPFFRVAHACRNLDGQPRQVDLVFEPRFARGSGPPARVFAFGPGLTPHVSPQQWQAWYERGGYSFAYELAKAPYDFCWGIAELTWGGGRGHGVFLPALCVSGRDSGGLTWSWDNRTSLGIQADTEGVRALKRFYLAGRRGFSDDGFDSGDGDGKIPYEVSLGCLEQPTWEQLYHDYYLAAYPLYRWDRLNLPDPLPAGDFGGHEPFFTSSPWTEESARAQAVEAGVRYATLWFGHANHDKLASEFHLPGVEWAHRYGMRAALWENVMVAAISGDLFTPEMHYGRFPDAWVRNADGDGPFINWEGICCSDSPRFSFGREKLRLMKRFVEQYGFDDAYLDVYHFGPQCDYGHTYQQYPFFPFVVGINEHLVEWARFLHQRGMSFTVNAPHPTSSTMRFGDIITADAGDLTVFALWFKPQTGHRVNGNLGSFSWQPDPDQTRRFRGEAGKFRFNLELSLFNGAFPRGNFYDSTLGRWKTADEAVRAEQMALWSRNMACAWQVAQAALVAGEPFRHYVYRHRSGTVFVAARNGTLQAEQRRIALDLRWAGLKAEGTYAVFEWDMDTGAALRAERVRGQDLAQGLTLDLEPEETKLLVVVPWAPVVQTPFLAYWPQRGAYTVFTTGEFTEAGEAGASLRLGVTAVPGRQTVTRLRLPEGPRPAVRVERAPESRVAWLENGQVEVTIRHGTAPAQVVLDFGEAPHQ